MLTWKIHKDKQNALKSLVKEVILSWESLEKHSQISVRTLSDKPTIIVVYCKLRSHVLKNQDLRFFYNFQNFVT